MSELRWNPILEEWVVTATHRQDRTFLPPKDYCPLCPTKAGKFPTEVPSESYEIVCFENKFPSFNRKAPDPAVDGNELYPVDIAQGICEVVLYTDNHDLTLADMDVDHIEKLVHVWTDRYNDLGSRKEIKYVFIFENKGEVIGVTISHAHGQIYAFPFIPPKIAKEIESSKKHMEKTGHCLFCDVLAEEIRDGRRIVCENESFVAVIPFFARYPYEVHIFSREHKRSIAEFSDQDRANLASILKDLLGRYDRLWGFSFPYMMVMHQAPTDGEAHDECHFHIEFYPPHRTQVKLKYLAGCESGAGTFINDTLAEEKAAELREA
jgi:UDPglucose--hexose-1-phosphate uridylyltransferase